MFSSRSPYGIVYAISLVVGIITLLLPSASAVATYYGETSTFYSRPVSSILGPLALLLYITSLFLYFKRQAVATLVTGFLGAGLQAYLILTKVADMEQKLTARGYEVIKTSHEYGTVMSWLAILFVVLFGIMILVEPND